MGLQDHVFPASHTTSADVGTPQVENLVWRSYQSENLSDRVAAGRANSAFNSEQVPVAREVSEAPLEGWSRGCRRAHVWFWFWLWSRLSPLVPKSRSRCPSRSPRKSWKPASTSNLPERACRHTPDGPAPTFATDCWVVAKSPKQFEYFGRSSYAAWAIYFVPEIHSCPNLPLQYLVRWPFLPLVRKRLIPSCPNPSTTSSVGWRVSVSAIARCATRTISHPCVPCPGAKTVAIPVNSRRSPSLGNGRSVCRGRKTATTIRIPRIRSARLSRADFPGPQSCWAAALLYRIDPCDCTDRSKGTC
jgi:hypothetical protein